MHKFELRKISYNSRLSEETSAYAADLWVDGRLFCHVSNHGHGGCDMQRPAKGVTPEQVRALNDEIKATYPKRVAEDLVINGKPFEMEQDIESICGELLADHLIASDLRRILKRTIAFVDPTDKKVRDYKGKFEGVQRAHLVTHTLRTKPGAVILNNLPFDEALAIFKAKV
jgi:hypothetical protein